MPTKGEHFIYDYRLQNGKKIVSTFSDLMREREKMEKLNIPVITKMYERRIAPLYKIAAMGNLNKPVSALNETLLEFFDLDLVHSFLVKPDNVETLDPLVEQLAFISSGVGNMQTEVAPYDEKEMSDIFADRLEYYSDLTFVYSFHHYCANAPDQVAATLHKYLSASGDGAELRTKYGWEEALMYTALIHAAWSAFSILDDADRQKLLQHYFYLGVVLGVPVRYWLKEAVEQSRAVGVGYAASVYQTLLNSKEMVPIITTTKKGKNFPEISKAFMARIVNENVSSLTQEKFIGEIYKGQANEAAYSGWLRESLNIMLHLKNGDILAF